ncbi:TadE/TadG family type IV pilus assembly protein [Agromyces sp. NPDC057865]|uniref:TadE/TadG family type IV pilus assembly protein n=1 Tax=Agromyces sp. NPDC057865 TaxID=3346267 RepID=UPI00366D7070
MRRISRERGAAAVEFALIVPVLLLLVFGIFEFSRLYNEQISLSNAARASARVMAISNDQVKARTAATSGAPALDPLIAGGQVSFSPATCSPGGTMTVTITYPTDLLTGWFGASMTLTGKGAMPCGG